MGREKSPSLEDLEDLEESIEEYSSEISELRPDVDITFSNITEEMSFDEYED
jgi:hypothetical protein